MCQPRQAALDSLVNIRSQHLHRALGNIPASRLAEGPHGFRAFVAFVLAIALGHEASARKQSQDSQYRNEHGREHGEPAWQSHGSISPDQLLLGNRQVIATDQLRLLGQRFLLEGVFHFLPELFGQVAPDILPARRGVPVRRFGRLHRRCPGGVGAGSLTGLVARLLTLLPHPPHGDRARRAGLLHLLNEGVDLLDDSLLFGLGIFTGLRLAQPLLDVPHLLDDLAKRAASLALLTALLLTLLAGQLLELVVDLLVLAVQPLILLLGFLSAPTPRSGLGGARRLARL